MFMISYMLQSCAETKRIFMCSLFATRYIFSKIPTEEYNPQVVRENRGMGLLPDT